MQQGSIAPSITIFGRKSSRQILDYLLSIFSPLVVKHIFLDALTNIPFHQANFRIDIDCNMLASIVNNAANI